MPQKKRGLVVVVEDDEALREGLVRGLSHEGFSVTSAEDGQAGLELIERSPGPFHALVVDLDMPRKRGDELIYELDAGAIAFSAYVVISGHPIDDPLLQKLRSHPTRIPLYYFPKPFDVDALVKLLDELPVTRSKEVNP